MRRKNNAKFVKGLKDYQCFNCGKEIPRGARHVSEAHVSKYLGEAWKELTKYHPRAKIYEVFISLRFCSGRCYRQWERIHKSDYEDHPKMKARLHDIEIATRNRRLEGWKNWKTWQEVFKPLDDRYRVRGE